MKAFVFFFSGSSNITDNWIRLRIEEKMKTTVQAEMSYILLLYINVNKGKPLPFIGESVLASQKLQYKSKESFTYR
jgi:hypothetical protein